MSKYTLNNLQDLCKVMIKDIKNQKTYLNKLENENIYLQNEKQQLQQKVNQLETNRDDAIEYLNNCIITEVFYDTGSSDLIPEADFFKDRLLEILERGKE